ncbi:hypothetical protein HMPREF6485_1576 [Segatella buccae ATCC 33574]|uniref:Uncharacterized protein n=1 Tax=Segatella buccae ATCC 33574 TaxID=873513 RepID=E6K7Z7_9BACT|nr:hypothetical protein HMPREF6485_1576 [Segatella buccae ATCC 33574]
MQINDEKSRQRYIPYQYAERQKTTFMESPYTKQIGLPEVSGSPICLSHCAQSYEYHCMS